MDTLYIFVIALAATIIGAVPLGLVNLSVLDVAYLSGKKEAMKLAYGAAIIEVLYGAVSLFAGTLVKDAIAEETSVKYLSALIPFIVGFIFLIRKKRRSKEVISIRSAYLQGAFLNILSVQVFLYWIAAIAFIQTSILQEMNNTDQAIFLITIGLGKIGVLFVFAHFSLLIMRRFTFVSVYMNKIIGGVLIFISLLQLIK